MKTCYPFAPIRRHHPLLLCLILLLGFAIARTASAQETLTFEQNDTGQVVTYPDGTQVTFPNDNLWTQPYVTGTDINNYVYVAAYSNWSDATQVADGSDISAIIPTGGEAWLNGSVSIQNLTVDAGSLLTINSSNSGGIEDYAVTLTLANSGAGTLENNALITVEGGEAPTTVAAANALTISGTGAIGVGGSATIAGPGVITVDSGSTIEGGGGGVVSASLVNQGLITADDFDDSSNGAGLVSTLSLTGASIVNSGTLSAVGNGLLYLTGGTINNAGGLIASQSVANPTYGNFFGVDLDGGVVITGGTLAGTGATPTGSGAFRVDDSGATLSNLTLAPGTNVLVDTVLNLTGSIANNGVITLPYGLTPTVLNVPGSATLSGSGTINLISNGQVTVAFGATLTQDAGNTIQGGGTVTGALANGGVVNANGSTLTLSGSIGMTNSGTMGSTNGGLLDISGVTITQSSGGQLLANGGDVQFDSGATIIGGALNSSTSTSVFNEDTGATLNGVTNNAAVNVADNTQLNLTGAITDNGSVSANGGDYGAHINAIGADVSGSGAIVLNGGGASAVLTGTLAQESQHTISGSGEIAASLTNYGLVDANYSGQTLYVTGSDSNYGTMESTNGSTLDIQAATINQGSGGQILANGGNVQFDYGATISGGALNSSTSTAVFNEASGATFNGVTNNATVNVLDNTTLNITGGLTDNGIIALSGGFYSEYINFNNATVSGSGTIVMNSVAQLTGTLTQASGHTISGPGEINAAVTNNGLINSGLNGQTLFVNGATTNAGTIEASNGGILQIQSGVLVNLSGSTLTGGTYNAQSAGEIILPGSVTTNDATVILNGAGSSFGAINSIASNEGKFAVFGGQIFSTQGDLANSGTVVAGTGSEIAVNGAFTQTSTGSLAGSGTLAATALTLAGTVSPGALSALTLDGTTTFLSDLQLDYSLGSLSGPNDQIDVSGDFTLDGTLDITALNGFGPGLYDLIDYSGGSFVDDPLVLGSTPAGYTYQLITSTPGQVDVKVTSAVPEPGAWGLILTGLGVLGFGRRFRRTWKECGRSGAAVREPRSGQA
jgi:fibronectin-binding autotransporter adhesin